MIEYVASIALDVKMHKLILKLYMCFGTSVDWR